MSPKCPGQDGRSWTPEDIYELPCPRCGHLVEFFKDDRARPCDSCGHRFANPRHAGGCAAHCAAAEQCGALLDPE